MLSIRMPVMVFLGLVVALIALNACGKTERVRNEPGHEPQVARTTVDAMAGQRVDESATLSDLARVNVGATPSPVATATTETLPLDLQARYRHAEQIDIQEGARDANGYFTRTRLLRTTMKYRHLRVEERWHSATPRVGAAAAPETLVSRQEMVADHLVVRVAAGRTQTDLEQILRPLGAVVRDSSATTGIYLVSFPAQPAAKLTQIKAALVAEPTVALAEPDFVVHTSVVPNDPTFAQQWALNNTGQAGGALDADTDAPEAWALHTGSRTVKVAVIDTGIDLTHPDLVANLWTNTGEIPGNLLDDDGNGYVDDVAGWNAHGNNGRPMDDNMHGTHVAGTIGAVGNNTVGVTGVCWQVSLVPVKFLDAYGSGFTSDAADAITYATRVGVQVMSNSWGGSGSSQVVRDAIMAAHTRGIVFVAAAGNNARDNDQQPTYPASYDCPNIIAVAASDRHDQLAYFSNFGRLSVAIAAPGRSILSTMPVIATPTMTYENLPTSYGSLSGTSMATPHVSGAVALLKSFVPSLTGTQLKARVLQRADHVSALYGKVTNAARLNLHRTLLATWTPAPPSLTLAQNQINDSEGNSDGLLAPGEIVRLIPTIANLGDTSATGVSVSLSVGSGATLLSTAPEPLSNIAPGFDAQPANPLRLRLAASVTDGQIVTGTLTVRWTTSQQTTFTVPLTVTVLQPRVETELTFHAGDSVADPLRNMVYVYDLTNPGVRGIDTGSGRITVRRTLVGTAVQASDGRLAISHDGARLYASVPALGRIDELALPALTLTRSITLPFYPGEFVVGANGRLYVGSYDDHDVLREVHALTGAVTATLSRVGGQDYLDTYNHLPLLRTSPDGRRLYATDQSIARTGGPGYVFRYDIATAGAPQLTGSFPYEQRYPSDFDIDEPGGNILMLSGGVYGVQIMRMASGEYHEYWPLSYGARAICSRPGDAFVHFGADSDLKVVKYRRSDGKRVAAYPVGQWGDEMRGLAITPNGTVLYLLERTSNGYASSLMGIIGLAAFANDAPVAQARSASVVENGTVAITLTATDANSDPLTFTISTPPAHGTVTGTPPNLTYRPATNYHGPDQFAFTASDDLATSTAALVTVTVTPVNQAPVAQPQSLTVPTATPLAVVLTAIDIDADPLTYRIGTGPTHGTLTGSGSNRTYRSNAGYRGIDSFTFIANDGRVDSNVATITIGVDTAVGAGDSWPTYGYGPERTGFVPTSLSNLTAPVPLWSSTFTGNVNPVAVGAGLVYAAPYGSFGSNYLYALDLATGQQVWQTLLDNGITSTVGPPSYANGTVYLQYVLPGNGGSLAAISSSTGSVVWRAPYGEQFSRYLAPAVTADQVFHGGGQYGGLVGVRRSDGVRSFAVTLPQVDGWAPAATDGVVYTWVNEVFTAHRPTDGSVLWSLSLSSDTFPGQTVPVLAGGKAYVFNARTGLPFSRLSVIDLTTRQVGWQVNGTFSGSPVVAGTTVYATTPQGVAAFRSDTGNLIGTYAAEGTPLLGHPIVTNDALIHSTTTGTYLYRLGTWTPASSITANGYLALAGSSLVVTSIASYAGEPGVVRAFRLGGAASAPTVVQPAQAAVNPVATTSVGLTVLGGDAGGEAGLTYTWSCLEVDKSVSFSASGTNQAKQTEATFSQSGSHRLQVVIANPNGLQVSSTVTVTVTRTLTSIQTSSARQQVPLGQTEQFYATVYDQFGLPYQTPPPLTWSVNGGGTISASGLLTAATVQGGLWLAQARSGLVSGSTPFFVIDPTVVPPTVTITSPENGASFVAPATFTLRVAISGYYTTDLDRLDVYRNGVLLGGITLDIPRLPVSGLPVGQHTYVVKAVDRLGRETPSNPLTITITDPGTGVGRLTQERWTGIPGTGISALTADLRYPFFPTQRSEVTSFQMSANTGDNYGTRLHGYLCPPFTTEYTFWLAGDDNCELWLSTDADPARRQRIARVPGWTAVGEWYKYPEQRSEAISLVGGQRYYIMALHKEGTGGDHLAVYWQAPYLNGGIIDGAYLQTAPPSTGAITRELWTGITGTTVASLTANARYPGLPNQRSTLTSFEAPAAAGDNYGSRIHGWVIPPETGTYVFWIAGDDNCELWLGTNEATTSQRVIAQVPGWTAAREWTKYPQQTSAALTLTKGRPYAIMALHKEGGGGDNVAVAWQGPGLTRQVIAGQYLQPAQVPSGSITREVWTGLTGNTVANLTSSSRFPTQPTSSDELASMETTPNSADNYGTRLHGYVIPPLSGVFTFWVAGDDNCELWLSTDETPANRQLIARVPGSTASRQWTKYPEQMSLAVTLTAGRKYYIMALQKEGTGGDHLAVAWQGPGMTQTVIAGPWLAPFVPGGRIMAFDDDPEPPRPVGNAALP